jgi:hypothetical protein
MSPRLKSGLLLVLVFAAGGALGAGIHASLPHPPRPVDPLTDLDLDASQRARAKEILDRHRPELEAALKDVQPRIKAIQDDVEIELRRDVLTEPQRKKLDELKKTHLPPPLPPPPR